MVSLFLLSNKISLISLIVAWFSFVLLKINKFKSSYIFLCLNRLYEIYFIIFFILIISTLSISLLSKNALGISE